jgi:DNA invertase Pin-like site-specific DNA recombinase
MLGDPGRLTMATAVAYCRVSGPSQISGDGFPRQIAAITASCESKGFELIHEYLEEAVPGKLDEESRPAFQEMISDLLGNGCRTIVVEALHRLAREYRTQEHLVIYLASKGITLISADTGEDITAAMMGDPMRRALVQIQGIFAELEKNLLVAKLAKARQRRKERVGKGQGRHAFGEKLGEAQTLEQIWEWRATGATCAHIADDLNALQFKTRSGKPWRASVVSKILARQA